MSDAPKKKPTDDEDLDDVIKVTKDSYPLEQSQYKDIRNIPVEDIFKSLVDNRSNIFYPDPVNMSSAAICIRLVNPGLESKYRRS